MDIANIASFVSSVGFPIVACCWMFLQYDKMRGTLEENNKLISELKSIIERVLDKLDEKE